MAISPHVSVRLSPSMKAALEYIADRRGELPAALARQVVAAYVAETLRRNGWERQAQDAYMAALARPEEEQQ